MGGVVGIENYKDAAGVVLIGLVSLQHRGQESSGITVWEKDKPFFNFYKHSGLVSGVYTTEVMNKLSGTTAIGQVRYPTHGQKTGSDDTQPFMFTCAHGNVAIALSGNIINTENIRKRLAADGAIFQHSADTELIVHLFAGEKLPLERALSNALKQIEGGYGGIMLYEGKLIAFRDPHGFRPLVLGKLGSSYMVASETPAIEVMGGKYIRDINPGELLIIEKGKLKSTLFTTPAKEQNCIFEQVYLSRPDSTVRGKSVAAARMAMGRKLAQQMKGVKADFVMPVPDSGFFAALGFSKESGLDFQTGFVRNHYMGRSFIKTTQPLREHTAKLKLFPIKDVVKGKNIVLVDDSIVRGTTAKKMIKTLREAGAKKIHFAVTSPPIVAPCFYGINTPSKKELIACNVEIDKIAKEIGVDSMTFITSPNSVDACKGTGSDKTFCSACFTDKYPTKISKTTRDAR
ncbi:amidophosphoribosyltransferase [Parelusimicrobium proximum]|uniref:amidophosphoribosyltransferase n=1 Tax=Parelusimicrobium proximum TaxID=3228953 RepID=UPI003D173B5C